MERIFKKSIYNLGLNLNIKFDSEKFMEKLLNYLDNAINNIFIFLIIIIIMYLIIKIGNKIIDKFVKNQIKSKLRFTMDKQKALTVGAIMKSVLKYLVYISGVAFMIGRVFKIPSGVLSAVGFVVGIGSQSLVKDLINGFFIIFEDQFGVGDKVTIGSFTGSVESIGIRTTFLKDINGDIHIFQNGNITQITNHSKNDAKFSFDIEIYYKDDIEKATDIIKKEIELYLIDNSEQNNLNIELEGIADITMKGILFRIQCVTNPLLKAKVERELKRNIKLELYENEIKMPYSKKKIIEE